MKNIDKHGVTLPVSRISVTSFLYVVLGISSIDNISTVMTPKHRSHTLSFALNSHIIDSIAFSISPYVI
jgi:hypothetical protein